MNTAIQQSLTEIPEDHYLCNACKEVCHMSSMRFVDDGEILEDCDEDTDGFCALCGSFNITVHGEAL